MATISAIVPTIDGREPLYEQTLASLRATQHDVQVVTVRNRPTIGEAWNNGAMAADGEYLWFGADDVILHPGWAKAATEAARHNIYPAPRIIKANGEELACGSMGGGWLLTALAPGAPVVSSQFPFMAMDVWREVGPCLPIHYYADDYLAARARWCGLSTEYVPGYSMVHAEGTHGRDDMVRRSMTDRLTFEYALGDAGLWQ